MPNKRLLILHCFRAPVGGLFRHVMDLARAQAERGNRVGILCDATTGGDAAERTLTEFASVAELGIHRVPMPREFGFADIQATLATRLLAAKLKIDVLHGHGAKGGAYARGAVATLKPLRQRIGAFYTPHGGSLHYDRSSLKGKVFLGLEASLLSATDGIIFESDYSLAAFTAKVKAPGARGRVVHNGLLANEFVDQTPVPDAADFLFIGELRHLKGVDLLLEALAKISLTRPVTAVIVGAGPDAASFKARAAELRLNPARVRFLGARQAQDAFPLGRCLVVPSRAESLPYIVLEAAARRIPQIATNVGGIPEIFGRLSPALIEPGSAESLTAAMRAALQHPELIANQAARLQACVAQRFTVGGMTSAILDFYRERLALAAAGSRTEASSRAEATGRAAHGLSHTGMDRA